MPDSIKKPINTIDLLRDFQSGQAVVPSVQQVLPKTKDPWDQDVIDYDDFVKNMSLNAGGVDAPSTDYDIPTLRQNALTTRQSLVTARQKLEDDFNRQYKQPAISYMQPGGQGTYNFSSPEHSKAFYDLQDKKAKLDLAIQYLDRAINTPETKEGAGKKAFQNELHNIVSAGIAGMLDDITTARAARQLSKGEYDDVNASLIDAYGKLQQLTEIANKEIPRYRRASSIAGSIPYAEQFLLSGGVGSIAENAGKAAAKGITKNITNKLVKGAVKRLVAPTVEGAVSMIGRVPISPATYGNIAKESIGNLKQTEDGNFVVDPNAMPDMFKAIGKGVYNNATEIFSESLGGTVALPSIFTRSLNKVISPAVRKYFTALGLHGIQGEMAEEVYNNLLQGQPVDGQFLEDLIITIPIMTTGFASVTIPSVANNMRIRSNNKAVLDKFGRQNVSEIADLVESDDGEALLSKVKSLITDFPNASKSDINNLIKYSASLVQERASRTIESTPQGVVETAPPDPDQDVKDIINIYGERLKFNSNVPLADDQNPMMSIASHKIEDKKYFLTGESGKLGDHVFTGYDYDALKEAGYDFTKVTPKLIKATEIKERMDIPYNDWLQNEVNLYKQTQAQGQQLVTKADAPVQEGQEITLGDKTFNVTFVDENGVTLNEIDKNGNLTEAEIIVPPQDYDKVFGVPPSENAQVPTENVTEQGQVVPEAQQAEQIQAPQFPLNKNGDIDYKQITDPALYARGLTEEFGDGALAILDGLMAEQQEALEKSKKTGSVIDKARKAKVINAELAKLAQVKNIINPAQAETQIETTAPKLKEETTNDQKDITGISGQIPDGKEPVQTQPVEERGREETGAGRILQTQEEPTEEELRANAEQADRINEESLREAEDGEQGMTEAENAFIKGKSTIDQSPDVDLVKANEEVDIRPTEAQKEAGNYQKGHLKVNGLDISIENPAGSIRKGTDRKGNDWAIMLNNSYGYIRRTVSPEGNDQIDVFLGDNLNSDSVYVIDQIDPETGKFDEHKVMIGFNSARDAKDNYLANYEPGWKGFGDISKMSMDAFKEWVFDKEATQKPLAYKKQGKEPKDMTLTEFAEWYSENGSDPQTRSRAKSHPDGNDPFVLSAWKEASGRPNSIPEIEIMNTPDFAGEALDNTPRARSLSEFKKGDLVQNVQTKKEYEVVSITKVGKSFNGALKEKGGKKISNFNGRIAQWVPVQKEVSLKPRKKPSTPGANTKTGMVLAKDPNNFEEAVMHFFIGGGKIWTGDIKNYVTGTHSPKELRSYFGLYANDGIHMDVLHEHIPYSFGIEDNADPMAEIDTIVDVLRSYNTRSAMIDELLRRQEEPVDMSYSDEDHIIEADIVDPEIIEVSNDIFDDKEIKPILEEFMNEDGSLDVDKLLAKIEEDEGYFTIFPFAIKKSKLIALKSRLQDEQRRRSQENSNIRPGVGDNEGQGRGEVSDRSDKGNEGGNGAEETARTETTGGQEIAIPGSDVGGLRESVVAYFGDENIDYKKSSSTLRTVVLKDGRTFDFINEAEWSQGEYGKEGNPPAKYLEREKSGVKKQAEDISQSKGSDESLENKKEYPDLKTKDDIDRINELLDEKPEKSGEEQEPPEPQQSPIIENGDRKEKKETETQKPEEKKSENIIIQSPEEKNTDGEVSKQEEQPSLSPVQQKQIAKINKEYAELIGKKQDLIDQAEKDMRAALLKADERNGLFGDTNPVEKDEIIKREEQGFTYSEATRAAVKKPFEERIAELRKQIEELKLEQKGKIESVIKQEAIDIPLAIQELFAEPVTEPIEIKPIDKESLPKLEDFGEKIGGARKDMGITRTVRDTDSMPAWRRKYNYANADGTLNLGAPIDTSKPFMVQWSEEIATWNGKRTVHRPVTTIDTREVKIFNSEAEAEAYIPIYEVWKQNFRVRKKDGNYVITKRSSTNKVIEYATFPTEEEANAYLLSTEGATSLLNHKREDFSIPALDKVERTGTDWRKGKDVSTEEFMETFGFRGGEFGNWVKPEERRVMLNAAYDSFMDLAELLNVPPRALSLGGELSIAFGARGTKGTAAHFEHNRAVINLTRMNGAGNLAHEWAHAMDNYFGLQAAKKDYTRDEKGEVKAGHIMRTTADLLSLRGMRKDLSDLFDKIVDAIQQKSVTQVMYIDEKQKAFDKQKSAVQREGDDLIKKFENGVRRYKYNRQTKRHEETIIKATPEQIKKAKAIIEKILDGKGTKPKWDHIPDSKGHFEYSYISPETLALNDLHKEVFGRTGLKRDGNGFYNLGYFADKMYRAKEVLDKALAGESETLTVPTDFMKVSKEFDKSRATPYWSSKVEMFARAFEYFIETKLQERNVRSDYLQYDKAPVYDAVYGNNPYPAGEERELINRQFQKFFDEVKTKTDENNVSLLYENETDYVKDQLDGYDKETDRQDAIKKTVERAEGERIALGRGDGSSILQKILPRTILEGFKESGYVNVIGQKVESPQDIADLWAIHRSPYIEKSHVIFVREGKIVGSAATTINNIGSTIFIEPQEVLNLYKKYKADGVYYLHNHPSGNHRPSAQDIVTTKTHQIFLARNGANLLGHLVVDHEKFSFIDIKHKPAGEIVYYSDAEHYINNYVDELEYKNPVPRLFSERESLDGTGQKRMLEIAKALLTENKYKGAVVYLSSNLEIAAYDVFPDGASAKDIIRIAREGLKNNLGRSVIFIHDGSYGNELVTNGQLPYDTLDVINTGTNESQWFSKEARKGYAGIVVERLWEGQPEYKKPEFAGEYLEGEQNNKGTFNPESANILEEPQAPYQFAGDWLANTPNPGPNPDLLKSAAQIYKEKEAKREIPETIQGIREYIQDMNLPVRKFEEEVLRRGGKQNNSSKPYRDMSLSFGRQEKLYKDFFNQKMKPILRSVYKIKKAGMPGEEILPYIIAKHAIERNALMRDKELKAWIDKHPEATPDKIDEKRDELKDKDYSGVMAFDTMKQYHNPDELARDIVSEFESRVDKVLIDELWDNIRNATAATLETWEAGNQLSPEQKQEYLEQYRYFVPLRGWRNDAAKELVYTKGDGFSHSLKKAEGRKSLADNPLAYILSVQFQAIAEQVDNEVKTAMYNLIAKNLNNPEINELATIKKLYNVKVKLPDGTEAWMETDTRPAPELFASGDAKTKIYREHERLRSPHHAREHEVIVRKPGGDMIIVFKKKQLSVAQALNKQNYMYRTIFGNIYDARDVNKVMALMGHLNNMLKAAYTSWNVVFPFTNFMRDFQEATITQSIKQGTGLKVMSNYRGAFPAVFRNLIGKPNLNNQMDRDLQDFYNLGGATGYTHTKTIEEIEKDIDREVERLINNGTITGSIKNTFRNTATAIEVWNKVFEDATRFSVYLSSLAAGKSKQDAAIDAKEASVNFNRKGKGSKAWDSWFAFFNVAIQSLQKNFKLAKDYRGKFSAVATSFMMLGFLEALMNALTDDDDKDSSYYNINPYMRQNYLVIPNLPRLLKTGEKGNKYLSIPLPQFWRGFKSMGAIAFDVATGKMKIGEGIKDAIGNFGSALLPIDVGGFWKSGEFSFAPIVPTIVKPVVEVLENRNYMGYTIKNEPFTREQKKYLANAGLGKNNVSPAAKFLTDMLFRWGGGKGKYKYYYDQETGERHKVPGVMDINPSTIEHIFKGYTGGTGAVFSDLIKTVVQATSPEQDIDFRNVPFINRFIRKVPEAKWNIISEYYNLRDDERINTALSKESVNKAERTGDWSEVTAMYGNEYLQRYHEIFRYYESELDDAAKMKDFDIVEGSKLSIGLMEKCINDIKSLKKEYGKK